MIKQFLHNTKIGEIIIAEENGKIVSISFGGVIADNRQRQTQIIKKATEQIDEYLGGNRIHFDLPLKLVGTDFQNKVWNALKNIPYGETKTYKQIACEIGNPRAARAVGMVNNKNPLPIIIPCHRVIGANGELTGYAGGLKIKKYLIDLEKQNKNKILVLKFLLHRKDSSISKKYITFAP